MRRRWNILRLRLRSAFGQPRLDDELDKEFRFHLDQQIAESVAAGLNPEEARYQALRNLGGMTQRQEECRDMRRTVYWDNFLQDLRYAARALQRSPGFAAVIILTLALSIGANSAIFSVINGVLLQPLPYPNPGRLVRLFLHNQDYPRFPMNPYDFRDFRARNHSFEAVAAYTRADMQLSGQGEAEKLNAFAITAGYFRVLGTQPELGREFNTKDELHGNNRSAIISERLWRTRFAARRDILGQTILLDSEPFTIIGVAPPGLEHPGNNYHPLGYGEPVDAWRPFTFGDHPEQRGSHFLEVVGRLKANVTPEQARGELNGLMAQLAREFPDSDAGWSVLVMGLQQTVVASTQRMLLVLLGAVGLVLLIACANAANLLLARATARQREMGVRAALGAGTGRLLRQMLTESLLIAFAGAAVGLLLAVTGVRILVSFLPTDFPRVEDIHVNAVVFAFTFLISLGTGLLFGLAPALQISRVSPNSGLREETRGAAGGRRHTRVRSVLVVCEVSLACVLLVGAGLLLRSFLNLLRSDYGFAPEHVITSTIALPYVNYQGPVIARFYDRLLPQLQEIPGVETVGVGSDVPWTGYDDNSGFNIEGKRPPPHQDFHGRYHTASPNYFRTLGIPLRSGRFFTDSDNLKSRNVIVINQRMATLYWGHENPVGQRISVDDHPKESDWMTIVGVVGDVKDTPNSPNAEAAFWWPLAQVPFGFSDLSVVIRSHGDVAALTEDLRRAVRRMDKSVAVSNVRLLNNVADASFSAPRFALFLILLFSALALTLAAVGTYGVISYSVSQRSREFGVRIALGAQPEEVLRMVLKEGMRLACWGVLIGLAAGVAFARVLDSLLYQVGSVDLPTLTAVAALSLTIAAVACWIPARRATGTDPITALRAE
ncbi:MAG TPA: ABC transporter permease [Bryobacteraceae bacterium]|jgi:predicted permease|nr:ABC transporter permease [Bryobacteraceae bacterium]